MQTSKPSAHTAEIRFLSDDLLVQLGHKLVDGGTVTRAQVDELNSRCALTGDRFDKILIKESIVSEEVVLKTLSELSGIPFRRMSDLNIGRTAVSKVQSKIALHYKTMPVDLRQGVLTLAVSEVPTLGMVDSIRMVLDIALNWVLCPENDISKSIKHFYGLGAETIELMDDSTLAKEIETIDTDVSVETADEGILKFLNQVIFEAIKLGATDIHIEPFENNLRLRYRIDGLLQEIPIPQNVKKYRKAIASCVKIMAELNIAERRKPHDGRIKVRSGDEEFDLRVSILPTRYGETVNMRLLNRKTMFIDLEHLGLSKAQTPYIEYFASLPHGVVLLTGPTGSGKTTTLYALLSRMNTKEDKIITVEDPVEYHMDGINQIQVNPVIDLTFATILRSILRHDPDIILIGEIRDMETADIAVRAALTGHLVFSTLHTNDAPSAITRLIDMGVEPYLVSSCLEGVVAQRLVRRICQACRKEETADESILEELAQELPDRVKTAKFLTGHGCPECNFTGFRGRIALFEIMLLDDTLRGMIVRQRPSNEIKHKAIENGLVTLRKDGWIRVVDGVTSIEEVVRVTRKTELPSLKYTE